MARCDCLPTIGITFSARAQDAERGRYRRALDAHRAVVQELTPDQANVELGKLDGLLLSGGGDVDPRHYGQSPRGDLKHVDPRRDEFELGLIGEALAGRLPLLGICRGIQVLGVALGATLVQDIPSEIGSAVRHADGAFHSIRVADGSLLHRILDRREVRVNSFHHQANGSLGGGARATAWSEDGVIEGVEHDGPAFVLGVQWHPERMEDDDGQGRLFEAFVAAAREHARGKVGAGRGESA